MILSPGVYAIRNTRTGKCYVGSSRNIDKRCRQHVTALDGGRHWNDELQKDWAASGKACFVFEVLEPTARDDSVLAAAEQRWVDSLAADGSDLYCRPVAGRSVPAYSRKLPRLLPRRERALLTQKELGELAGVSRAAIAAIEALKAEPQFSTIRKLAAALNCLPDDLMEPDP